MNYVYVLKSAKDNQNYAGYTKNLKFRFEQHQKGSAASAKN
jgi:predicted GIY-YIG superfamily endonuclease